MGYRMAKKRLKLREFLPYRLSVLSNRISRAIAVRYEEAGLTIPDWRVMAVLQPEPGLSAKEVAARTAMDKVAVSRAVSRLLAAGRIKREHSPDDRRQTALSLTKAGQQDYDRIAPMALAYEKKILNELGPERTKDLEEVLKALEDIQDRIEGLG